jgi:hypothetical protein
MGVEVSRIIVFDKVRNLEKFISELRGLGYVVEYGPHAVLEDHSELTTIKVYRDSKLVAYIIAHYITQYYRAVASASYEDDKAFLNKLYELKYSGEKWSIPVNPLYIVKLVENELDRLLGSYEDSYPVEDGESLVKAYRERNPNYTRIPRILLARLVE